MATPALRLLANRFQYPISVYFDTKPIGELYRNCEFIKVCSQAPKGRMVGSTRGLKRKPGESEVQAYCRILAGVRKELESLPHTYVDDPNKPVRSEDVAIMHGCLGEKFRKRKDLGRSIRQYIIDSVKVSGLNPVIIGSKTDKEKFWNKNDLFGCENLLGKLSLKDSVHRLSQCRFFISNDTGLYHVAGALRKDGLVIWKKTNFIKNQSPFKGLTHLLAGDMDENSVTDAIDKYLDNKL